MSWSIYGLSDGWMAVCSFILCPSECLSVCFKHLLLSFALKFLRSDIVQTVYTGHVDKSPNL